MKMRKMTKRATSAAHSLLLYSRNKMAAADYCEKSQDKNNDSLPLEMQTLKEELEKALKKPLVKEDTW